MQLTFDDDGAQGFNQRHCREKKERSKTEIERGSKATPEFLKSPFEPLCDGQTVKESCAKTTKSLAKFCLFPREEGFPASVNFISDKGAHLLSK
jgi:hypothetical protein